MGAEDFATFINKMYEAYDRYVKNALYDAMEAYVDTIPATFKKTGSITAELLNELCEMVSTATGYPVMLMGTRTALSKVTALQNASYITDAAKEQHTKYGYLGLWEGKELVEVPQVFEKNKIGQYKLRNDLIFVMPMTDIKFLKLVNEGDVQLRQIMDKDTNMDFTYESEIQSKLGVGVMLNSAFGAFIIE